MNDGHNYWKKNAVWIFPVIIGLAGFVLGWWFSGADRHTGTAAVVAVDLTGTGVPQIYTCSMHPQVRSPNPDDKCPICGMALIPVPLDEDEEDENDRPRLRLSPRAAALMQIEVWPVESRPVSVPVRVYGRIGYDETRLRTIAAWIPGRLDRLQVDFTGTAVRRGQPMVEIYSPTLITAQEEHLQALQTARDLDASSIVPVREAALRTVDASRDRLRLLGLDGEQIKGLEHRGRVEERLVIPAPFSGVVIEKLATAGDYVQTGQPIYRLADISHLWIALEVYETDILWVRVGQPAVFTAQSRPGEHFTGTVAFIDPVLNERTRTVGVRVELPNPDGLFKPGMFVRGTIYTGSDVQPIPDRTGHLYADHGDRPTPAGHDNDRALVIPATAPLITGRRAVVYVQLPEAEQPTFEPRDILLGPRAGAWYVVREGLAEGELVVTHGGFKIDAELQIRGRPSMMQPEGGPPPTHDHGEQAAPAHAPAAVPGIDPDRTAVPLPFQSQIGRLVTASFELVRALSGDDFEAAGQASLLIDQTLHGVEPALLTTNAHRRQWNRLAGPLHESLLMLAGGKDPADQRRHFRSFSETLIAMVHSFGITGTGPVYRVMCPMFEEGESFWLQSRQDITNPYFGAMMLTCGEIVETISETTDPHGGH